MVANNSVTLDNSKVISILKSLSGSVDDAKSVHWIMAEFNVNVNEVLSFINVVNHAYPELINISRLLFMASCDDAPINELDENLSYLYLNRELNWLNLVKIEQLFLKLMPLYCNEYKIKIIDSIDSTNTYILNNLNHIEDKTCVITEWQVNGRGRGNKSWSMRIATDITLSVLYFVPLGVDIRLLPLVVSVAISRLFKHLGLAVKIKWPNDIYINTTTDNAKVGGEICGDKVCGDKICGILVESGNINKNRFVVIGIGIDNILNMERNLFVCHILNNLENILNEYIAFGFMLIRQEWLDNCLHYNQHVSIYQNQEFIDSGLHVDLTEDGILVIKTLDGNIKKYDLSNFSLRTCSRLGI